MTFGCSVCVMEAAEPTLPMRTKEPCGPCEVTVLFQWMQEKMLNDSSHVLNFSSIFMAKSIFAQKIDARYCNK